MTEAVQALLDTFDALTEAEKQEAAALRRDRALPAKSGQFPVCKRSNMSESNIREELFAALRTLSEAIPEMRAGQLVAAIGELCADLHGRGLWNASDAELLETVWQFQRNFEAAAVTAGKQEA